MMSANDAISASLPGNLCVVSLIPRLNARLLERGGEKSQHKVGREGRQRASSSGGDGDFNEQFPLLIDAEPGALQ